MNPFLFIFLDGVGIGESNPDKNPFFKNDFQFLLNIFGEVPHLGNQIIKRKDKIIFPVDANLDVEGLPQSGTGQTSILCGVNAAKHIGKHFGPFAYSTLFPVIEKKNIFQSLKKQNKKVCFANAYPRLFFKYVNSGGRRLSVTSLSCLLSETKLNKAVDVWKGNALTAEITNERWRSRLKYRLPKLSPGTAAKRLIRIASKYNFTLYEYYLTDHLGHGRNKDEFHTITGDLDLFLLAVLRKLPDNMNLFICSDHGNFEDISIKMHTRNPAFALAAGKDCDILARNINSLPDIKKVILSLV